MAANVCKLVFLHYHHKHPFAVSRTVEAPLRISQEMREYRVSQEIRSTLNLSDSVSALLFEDGEISARVRPHAYSFPGSHSPRG